LFYVYILASLSGTLYVGLTDDLRRRVEEHKLGLVDGFTKKYNVNCLMYYETFHEPKIAEDRELQIKKWRRGKKIALFAKDESALGRFEQTTVGLLQRCVDAI
jgi:putative endonuclease